MTRSSAMLSTHTGWKWLAFECLGQANTHLLSLSHILLTSLPRVCFSKLRGPVCQKRNGEKESMSVGAVSAEMSWCKMSASDGMANESARPSERNK